MKKLYFVGMAIILIIAVSFIGYGAYYKKPYCRYEPTQPYYYEETPERVKEYGIHTGNGLMHAGLAVMLRGDLQSEVITLEKL